MTDLAIWMAGYVSVPLYPTLVADTVNQILTHSESRFIFVGKLDDWEGMKPGSGGLARDELSARRMTRASATGAGTPSGACATAAAAR